MPLSANRLLSSGAFILLLSLCLGCRPEVSPPLPQLKIEENIWTEWISARESNSRENITTPLPVPTDTNKIPTSEDRVPSLFYETGYSFPSLRARVFGEVVTIALQPHLKRVRALGISRLAFSPTESKVAIVFSKKFEPGESLLLLDLTKNAPEELIDNVYDFVWGNSDALLFYTLKPYGIPSELYALNRRRSEKILSADSPGESILIQGSTHKVLRIQKTYTPLATKVGILRFDTVQTGGPTIRWYNGSAVGCSDYGAYVISYSNNPLGELIFYPDGDDTKKSIVSGDKDNVLLGLVETSHGVIVYSGNGHSRHVSVVDSTGSIRKYFPPPPLLQLSASFSNGRISLYGESVLCPPEKLTELSDKIDEIKDRVELKTPSCTGVSTTLYKAHSRDGTLIPLTVTRMNRPERGVVLYVYGAYGVSLPLHYSDRLSFLAHEGYAIALCHARGGAEFGPHWHEQTRLLGKSLTIEDAESCVSKVGSLVPTASPVVGFGHSAGGWLLLQVAQKLPTYLSGLLLDAPMTSLPDGKRIPLTPSHRDLNAREELEWVSGFASPSISAIPHPKGTDIFTVIRGGDELVSPSSLAEWMDTTRRETSSVHQIISYVAKDASHSLNLPSEDERNVRLSWKEFLRGISMQQTLKEN